MINIIAAVAQNNIIGKSNKLPFCLKEDMARFKSLTTDNIVIMGKNTYLSIGKALPNRLNIVISKTMNIQSDNLICFDDINKALEYAKQTAKLHNKQIFICGGGQIYTQLLSNADKLYITRVHSDVDGDTYFPDVPEYFELEHQEDVLDNNILTTFCVYINKKHLIH